MPNSTSKTIWTPRTFGACSTSCAKTSSSPAQRIQPHSGQTSYKHIKSTSASWNAESVVLRLSFHDEKLNFKWSLPGEDVILINFVSPFLYFAGLIPFFFLIALHPSSRCEACSRRSPRRSPSCQAHRWLWRHRSLPVGWSDEFDQSKVEGFQPFQLPLPKNINPLKENPFSLGPRILQSASCKPWC